MEQMVCKKCGEVMESMAEHCNWCGVANKYRVTDEQEQCPECSKVSSPVFSYCPWCGKNHEGDERPRKKVKGFGLNCSCHICSGGIMKTMKYCPWCGEKIWDSKYPDDQCKSDCFECGASIHQGWQHCVFCGEYTQQVSKLSTGDSAHITKDALFFLALSAAERMTETRSSFMSIFDKTGFETLGFLFGRNHPSRHEVHYVFPLASAKSKTDGVKYNPYAIKGLDKVIKYSNGSAALIGVFHSHPHSDEPFPSLTDRFSMKKGSLEMIVSVKKTSKRMDWKWNRSANLLEGAFGRLFFRLGAYVLNESGVVEVLRINV